MEKTQLPDHLQPPKPDPTRNGGMNCSTCFHLRTKEQKTDKGVVDVFLCTRNPPQILGGVGLLPNGAPNFIYGFFFPNPSDPTDMWCGEYTPKPQG